VAAFGGICVEDVFRPGVTHLISAASSTDKCHQIRRLNRHAKNNQTSIIWILKLDWLYDSIYEWRRLDESRYIFPEDIVFFESVTFKQQSCSPLSITDIPAPLFASIPSLLTQADEDLALLRNLSDDSDSMEELSDGLKKRKRSLEEDSFMVGDEDEDESLLQDIEHEFFDNFK
jgi:hypothetical protein